MATNHTSNMPLKMWITHSICAILIGLASAFEISVHIWHKGNPGYQILSLIMVLILAFYTLIHFNYLLDNYFTQSLKGQPCILRHQTIPSHVHSMQYQFILNTNKYPLYFFVFFSVVSTLSISNFSQSCSSTTQRHSTVPFTDFFQSWHTKSLGQIVLRW